MKFLKHIFNELEGTWIAAAPSAPRNDVRFCHCDRSEAIQKQEIFKYKEHINFNFRTKYKNFFKKSFIAFFMFENLMIGLSKADDVCECISTFTYKTPNDQIRYVAKCYLQGEDKGILENSILPNQEAADQRTKYFMENYKIKKDACIVLPNGKMIAIPSK